MPTTSHPNIFKVEFSDKLNALADYLENETKIVRDNYPDQWREMHKSEAEKNTGLLVYNTLDEYDTARDPTDKNSSGRE